MISADTVNKVFELTQQEYIYKEVLKKYFPDKSKRSEFQNELWLYFLEHPQSTLEAFNGGYFKYWYTSIIKKQTISTTSNYHNKLRKHLTSSFENNTYPEQAEPDVYEFENVEEQELNEAIKQKKLDLVNQALEYYVKHDPLFITEAEMFRMYYFQNLSLRQISKKLHGIPSTTIYNNIQYAQLMVKYWIKKNNK